MPDERTDIGGMEHALFLGDGHWLDWVVDGEGDQERRIGVVVYHVLPPGKPDHLGNGMCAGGAQWEDSAWQRAHPRQDNSGKARWTLHGTADEHLTLSPSLLCSCGDHGFIRDGRWERC